MRVIGARSMLIVILMILFDASLNDSTAAAVEIVMGSHNKTLPIGFTTHLVCVAYGSPPPSIFWTSSSDSFTTMSNSTPNQRFIRYETIVGDFTESVLRIENLEPKDSGDYLCNAVNGAAQTAVTRTNRLAVSKVGAAHTTETVAGALLPLLLLAVSAGVTVLIFVWYKKCRKRSRKRITKSKNVRVTDSVLRNSAYSEHDMALHKQANFAELHVQDMLFHNEDFEVLDAIGEGEFSCVFQARLLKPVVPIRTTTESSKETMLAVKTLKGNYTSDDKTSLIKEGVLMHKFDHPNVISLLGICLDAGPTPYVILPFMENGSLISYLRKNKSKLLSNIETEEDEVCKSRKQLTDMCWQIAKGMEYLAKMKLIHRDLAARNCMIDENWIIKVADFGLSELLTSSKDYFRQSQDVEVRLPLKWLAPECIHEGIYSEKTDVWAYGVTCWEVFTVGVSPYPGLHPMSIPRQINQGLRLEKPDNTACTDEIYSMMNSCWEKDPELRPQFSELVIGIGEELENMTEYLNVSTFQ